MGLGCHVASAPFEKWHYLGAISNSAPSVVFKPRFVWSAADAVPTRVQFGVSLESEASLAQTPPEKVSAEVLETGRRIGQDVYTYVTSFAEHIRTMEGETKMQLPSNILEKWLARFTEKCSRRGLDWLTTAVQ